MALHTARHFFVTSSRRVLIVSCTGPPSPPEPSSFFPDKGPYEFRKTRHTRHIQYSKNGFRKRVQSKIFITVRTKLVRNIQYSKNESRKTYLVHIQYSRKEFSKTDPVQ